MKHQRRCETCGLWDHVEAACAKQTKCVICHSAMHKTLDCMHRGDATQPGYIDPITQPLLYNPLFFDSTGNPNAVKPKTA